MKPIPWPVLALEDEYTIFNNVPPGTIVKIIPARHVAPLMVDDDGLLAPKH